MNNNININEYSTEEINNYVNNFKESQKILFTRKQLGLSFKEFRKQFMQAYYKQGKSISNKKYR